MNIFALFDKEPKIKEENGNLEVTYLLSKDYVQEITKMLIDYKDQEWRLHAYNSDRYASQAKDISDVVLNRIKDHFISKIDWELTNGLVEDELRRITEEAVKEIQKEDWTEFARKKIAEKFLKG